MNASSAPPPPGLGPNLTVLRTPRGTDWAFLPQKGTRAYQLRLLGPVLIPMHKPTRPELLGPALASASSYRRLGPKGSTRLRPFKLGPKHRVTSSRRPPRPQAGARARRGRGAPRPRDSPEAPARGAARPARRGPPPSAGRHLLFPAGARPGAAAAALGGPHSGAAAAPARPPPSAPPQRPVPLPGDRTPLTSGPRPPGSRGHFLRAPGSERAGSTPATETWRLESPPALPTLGVRRPSRRPGLERPPAPRAAPPCGKRKEAKSRPRPVRMRPCAPLKGQSGGRKWRGSQARSPGGLATRRERTTTGGPRIKEQGATPHAHHAALPASPGLELAPREGREHSEPAGASPPAGSQAPAAQGLQG